MKEVLYDILNNNGQMSQLKQCIGTHIENLHGSVNFRKYKLPLLFHVYIDMLESGNVSSDFVMFLQDEPLMVKKMIEEIYHEELCTSVHHLRIEQVKVSIRFASLLPSELMDHDILKPRGLVDFEGVLVSKTTPQKYIRSSAYQCLSDSCKGQKIKRSSSARYPSLCALCGSENVEVLQAHDVGEEVRGYISPSEYFKNVNKCSQMKKIPVCFQDELICNLELGEQYRIVGYYYNDMFNAWSVTKCTSSSIQTGSLSSLTVKPFPPVVQQLYDDVRYACPLYPEVVFVSVLASCLASDMYPPEAFHNIKTALLLSLATLGEPSSIVPILVYSTEPQVTHDIMNWASKLAPRFIPFNCTNSNSAAGATQSNKENEMSLIDAEPLLLATGGVYYLGDWTQKTSSIKSKILSAIEQKQIGVIKDKSASFQIIPVVGNEPLKCAIWTYVPVPTKMKESHRTEINTLIKYFGVPFSCNIGCHLEEVTKYMLQSAMTLQKNKSPIPISELKETLQFVNQMSVCQSEEAVNLIQNYFVMNRNQGRKVLPVEAITKLMSLAEAHAKLSLHPKVTFDDALVALYLYENAQTDLFGECFTTLPPVLILDSNMKICHVIENKLLAFKSWITKELCL